MDVLANNLANVNTTGFKKDMSLTEAFPEKLLMKINDKSRPIPSRRNSEFDVYQAPVEVEPGVYEARAGRGYFVVETSNGKSYVKEIRFTIDDEGYLKTYYTDNKGDLRTDNIDEKYPKKTDYENYITDEHGNRLNQNNGDIGELLQQNVYYANTNVIGTMNAGVKFQKIVTDFSPGNLVETGGKFDLALNGPGFFKVQGEEGQTYYTRDGSFTINREGNLSTLDGREVLGTGGPINVNGEEFEVLSDGRVIVDGVEAGALDIVDIQNREFLRKIGDNLYDIVRDENEEPYPDIDLGENPYTGEVLQGYLEESNVNAITEMVEMITLLRDFETGQKTIRTHDEMMDKASNEIGRV
jgi:flagellar basal-body rod protein FlgG